ncbi:MAG: response regulator [Acidobacteriota bacterium]
MPATILVVDDSLTEQKLILEALKTTGHHILTADDGEQALEMARKHQPQLILLDVILPKKNGFQVCRQLKTAPETEQIKIVLVTSKTQDSDRFWGLKQGADDYLGKPFTPDELHSTLSKFV